MHAYTLKCDAFFLCCVCARLGMRVYKRHRALRTCTSQRVENLNYLQLGEIQNGQRKWMDGEINELTEVVITWMIVCSLLVSGAR